jgi:tetratricopeptide (TPR) repeat protein
MNEASAASVLPEGSRQPLVSVIVRSMDRPTLRTALDAIAAQDHPAIEVLVVAACGPAHPSVPESIGAHPARLIASGQPLARAAAANAGLDAARGEWITFLDDDDLILPQHVSGLVRAHAEAPDAGAVHGYARALFASGRSERFGQPHATLELFDRNYLHLSTAIFRRDLAGAGCRFDETLDVHEDWDFFIQLAQHTRFHFVDRETFVWHADAGSSGAGGGANQDDARFAHYRERVYAKWTPERDALVDDVTRSLELAAQAAREQDYDTSERHCREALARSQNDPWALNMLAMVERARGRIDAARTLQELAVAVRPGDAGLVHNLALLHLARQDRAAAAACAERALAIDATFAPALRLRAQLRTLPSGSVH